MKVLYRKRLGLLVIGILALSMYKKASQSIGKITKVLFGSLGRGHKFFRDCLTANKIYFEVVSIVLISGASLVVAYSALDINKKMLNVSEVAAMPHFSISERPKFDPATNTYVEISMFLNNNGAPVSNLHWKTKSFIILERSRAQGRYALIPINGYYFAHRSTSNVTGELESAIGYRNNDKFVMLYNEARLWNSEKDPKDYYFVKVVTFSRVVYEDRLGRQRLEYFKDQTKMPEGVVRQFFEYNEKGALLDLGNVSLADVVHKVDQAEALILDELP